ncbi:acylneuraminate cytidylyltransferase family protein [Candidatus Pelagibacter sp.]|nr:acylneuraminate cytidylyltransferase family protein [Candidatus Pelagibacter sp.]MDA9136735.1 acylneuraminate cytidylyltransferase family protein [Candidatus Pelagibacter sp.]
MYKNKKILAIVLARSGSKGIANKNIIKIKNKYLLNYTTNLINKIKIIDKAIISTDSTKFQKIANKDFIESPFLRSKKLSGDNVSDDACLLDALKRCEKIYNEKYDYVVSLPPTSPLRKKEDVIKSIKRCILKNLDSIWTVSKVDSKFHPFKIMKIENNKLIHFLKSGKKIFRRQQLSDTFIRNGNAYVIKSNYLKKTKKIISNNTEGFLVLGNQISIDTMEDVKFVKNFL